MPASSPPESPQAQQNPLLVSFNAWKARTPFVTRSLTISLVVMYLLSFFIRWEYFLSNIPYYTVQYFQIFRLVTSPFAGNSFFTLLLIMITFPAIGLKMESSMGSASYLSLIGAITLIVNVGFVLAAYTAYFMSGSVYGYDSFTTNSHSGDSTGQNTADSSSNGAIGTGARYGGGLDSYSSSPLLWICMDFWTVLFALLTLDCMVTPEMPRRLLCIPYDIPSKYLPLALYALICLLSGSVYISYLLSMGVGYAICLGYLDRLRPTSQYLAGLEAEGGLLRSMSRNEGYVLAGSLGHDSWIPVNQPDAGFGGANSADPMSQQGLLDGQRERIDRDPFPGSGRKLASAGSSTAATSSTLGWGSPAESSTAARPSKEEIAARRLAALEGGSKGNV